MRKQCTEIAQITLPWGGELLNYCPCHANRLVLVAQAMGSPIRAQLLPETSSIQCGSFDEISEEERALNATFRASAGNGA